MAVFKPLLHYKANKAFRDQLCIQVPFVVPMRALKLAIIELSPRKVEPAQLPQTQDHAIHLRGIGVACVRRNTPFTT